MSELDKKYLDTKNGLTRRSFIEVAGITAAGAALLTSAGCASKETETAVVSAEDPFAGCEEYYAACPPECQHHNLKALVKDGKIVKVENGVANESLPCMRGLARVNWLNSDERLKKPLLREGEKGENKWKEISWDEALDLIVEKLQDAIDTVGNKSIVFDAHAGNFNALVGAVGPAFMSRIGGNTSLTGTLCCAGTNGAQIPMFGKRYFDTRNTIVDSDYIIVWGNNPAVTMNGYFDRFEKVMEGGGKVVVIDPCFTETASSANEWIPIRPTTDTAMALGMLKVIVEEDLHNQEFLIAHSTAPCLVDSSGAMVLLDPADTLSYAVIDSAKMELVRHDTAGITPLLSTVGSTFEGEYKTAFDVTLEACKEWTPEAVEAETGVPADTVVRIAREYASAKKGMIIQNMGGFMRIMYGTFAVGSQLNLAVFTGHIGGVGNGIYDAGGINNIVKLSPMFDNPKVSDELPKIPRVQFANHVMNDDPCEIKVFISSRESPMTQFPNTGLVKEALKKIPFVVVIDSFMTSTALYADLVLPCAAVFECEDLLCQARSHLLQLSEKAIEPPGEARSDFDIFADLATRMGVGEDFQQEPEFYFKKALEGTDYNYDQLKEAHAIDAYPADFIPYKDGIFYTKSEKAEIYQPDWIKKGFKPVPAYYRAPESIGGSSGLDAKYPLAAVQRKTRRTVHASFGNLALINNVDINKARVMVNPQDAEARGIKDGDPVILFNDRGEHKAMATVTNHIIPGVVVAENGWWEQQGGSSSYVTNDSVGPIAGEHCCNETLVDIRKEA